MTFAQLLRATLIRVVGVTLVDAAYLAWLNSGNSTGDALGDGFLFFLIVLVVVLIWAFVDAVRRGFLHTLVLWILVAVLSGITATVVFETVGEADGAAGGYLSSVAFFAGLIGFAALVGVVLGGVVHRIRMTVTDSR